MTTAYKLSDSALTILATAVAAAGALWLHQSRKQKQQNVNEFPFPPHPTPCHFLWGNAAQLPDMSQGLHVDTKLLEWAKELGPVFSLKLPVIGRMIVVAEPDWIRHITISKNYNKSWTYKDNLPLLGSHSIVIAHGDEWRRQRKTFAPGFTTTFLKDMVSIMCDKMERFVQCVDKDVANQVPTNMMERSQTFTSDVIVQIAFGEDWGGDQPHKARELITDLTNLMIFIDKNIKARLFGFSLKRRLRDLQEKFDAEMNKVLDRRLQQLRQDNSNRKSNVCTLAIDSMIQPDGTLSAEDRECILHQLKTFYFAGHDTTATTISWAAWLLSQHSTVLEKLRAELRAKKVFNTLDQRPTYEQLQECEYLDAVVKEVLRLYPPAASARYVADPTESFRGYRIGGAVLYVNCYVTHRLPQYWDNPDDFIPERFVGVNPEEYAHKYIPFLKGPRDCLGKYFALLEAKLAISAMVQRYNMACVDPDESIGYRLTAYPRGGACVQMELLQDHAKKTT